MTLQIYMHNNIWQRKKGKRNRKNIISCNENFTHAYFYLSDFANLKIKIKTTLIVFKLTSNIYHKC